MSGIEDSKQEFWTHVIYGVISLFLMTAATSGYNNAELNSLRITRLEQKEQQISQEEYTAADSKKDFAVIEQKLQLLEQRLERQRQEINSWKNIRQNKG